MADPARERQLFNSPMHPELEQTPELAGLAIDSLGSLQCSRLNEGLKSITLPLWGTGCSCHPATTVTPVSLNLNLPNTMG
jgi:hypothetical protein